MADSKVAAAGYLITYFNDIESLTNAFGNYNNLLFELKSKYQKNIEENKMERIPDAERANLEQQLKDTRFWITRTYIKTVALEDKVKELKIEDLKAKYQKVMSEPVIVNEMLEEYVIELNKVFVNGVVVELVEKAGDVYAQLGGNYGP